VVTSQDPNHARTGLDAFQGLLGRLNGKSDGELKQDEQNREDRQLAMWTHSRWGGVSFVSGGRLVLGEECQVMNGVVPGPLGTGNMSLATREDEDTSDAARREERRMRKEEKDKRKDAAAVAAVLAESSEDAPRSTAREKELAKAAAERRAAHLSGEKRKKKRERIRTEAAARAEDAGIEQCSGTHAEQAAAPPVMVPKHPPVPARGRHLLRGKNIQAKKMAFADTKLLDQIFMKT